MIRVLLVDDDEDDFVLARDLLLEIDPDGFEVEWAAGADAARAALAENRHDICLMDYRLGEVMGTRLVVEAETLGFTGPIIMLTGQEDRRVENAAAAAGATDYLVKDRLDREHLSRAIRYALSRSQIQVERTERLQAEAASRSKSQFLATLSHEIRTPLTSIIGFAQLLLERYADGERELLEPLSTIQRNSNHLLSLINGTLDLSKIEAGGIELHRTELELGPFVADIALLARDMARTSGLGFDLVYRGDLPRRIETDEVRLRQILLNLLSNAMKFTESGSVVLEARCVEADEACHRLEFTVRDTGRGMSSEELAEIFEPFTQVGTPSAGSGLGLAISRRLAELLGGSLTATSRPGEGSEFVCAVDPGLVDFADLCDPNEKWQVVKVARTRGERLEARVLVVDDNADIRAFVAQVLGGVGAKVHTAPGGAAALALLEDRRLSPDVVVMDLHMPGLDGYATLHALRAAGHRMPVLALTAASMEVDRASSLAAGFAAFLPKPVSSQELLDVVRATLAEGGGSEAGRRGTGAPESRRDAGVAADGGSVAPRGEADTAGGDGGAAESSPSRPAGLAASSEAASAVDADASPGGIRVLVVEDDADAREAICALIGFYGAEAAGAGDVDEALDVHRTFAPDLVLADWNLAGKIAAEMLQTMHDRATTSRFLVLSGEQDLDPGLDFVEEVLVKPLSGEQLARLFE